MDPRARILEAAARVFAETGYRGATTRRIAQEASVNEVTLFRHFGSKDELLREAVAFTAELSQVPELPEEPLDARRELTAWARRHLLDLRERRSMIRTCMGELEEHADIISCASDQPTSVHRELMTYLERLVRSGKASPELDAAVAAAMLMGTLFSDAMGRDFMPAAYSFTVEDAAVRYVDLFLRAIGAEDGV
jgi:AcrR family transcriptional regulator